MFLLKGLLLGFALVAPIGMQNIYVFNNAFNHSMKRSMLYSLFVWISNTALALVGYFGFGVILNANEIIKQVVMFVGGVLGVWLAWNILKSARSVDLNEQINQIPVKKAILTAIVVIWANPQAVIDSSITLSAIRGTLADSAVGMFITGIVMATFIWIMGMTLVINSLKDRLSKKFLIWINVISGIVLLLYGVHLLYEVGVNVMSMF